jgi:hypothetical protein
MNPFTEADFSNGWGFMGTGRAAVIVFAVHVTLLFFPPIPPLYKGSVWSYALGYLTVVLAVRAASAWGPRMTAWWSRAAALARWRQAMAALVVVAGVGWLLRAGLPETFARFSREEGAWEPITLLCYAAAALLLLRRARDVSEPSLGRHLRLVGAGFVFLTLEEVDYLGIFGGAIGRIDGIYVGSLHDLLQLAKAELLPEALAAAGAVAALVGIGYLWRTGYVQPVRLVRVATSVQGLWLACAVAFQALAAAEEVGLLGVSFGAPSPEELIEMLGALCMAGFTLEVLRDASGASTASSGPRGRTSAAGASRGRRRLAGHA